ncbi:hypothetical protein NDU88_004378 [Pleurodeles waltl]|uniref:Helix-turn-helix domain-containing protein n=1 Tax=Pleurodeles waltl TaxID=8319 RepID=A0AAV7RHY8_PLEWA|nr:hypothetical protein NDU88_004378 [Pleurodeles waltl]
MIQIVNGKLVTDTYHKITDQNILLFYDSHHPKALRDNLPFGQFLRLRRNCSTVQSFEVQARDLKDKLQHRHYPTKIINPAYKRARHNHRESLLASTTRDEQVRLTCVSTYTPMSNTVKKLINKRWNILLSGRTQITKPLFAFKRSPNIRDLVIHTRPRKQGDSQDQSTLWNLPPVSGHYPCGSCNVCPLTKRVDELDLKYVGVWRLTKHTNCNTRHCIYLITCPCNLQYVGRPTNRLTVTTSLRTHVLQTPLDLRYNFRSSATTICVVARQMLQCRSNPRCT